MSGLESGVKWLPAGVLRISLWTSVLLLLGTASVAGDWPDRGEPGIHRPGFSEFLFGIKAGANFAQHVGTEERNADYTVSSAWRVGFAGGVFLVFPVTSRFSVQQEVLYVQKGSRQDIGVDILDIPTVLNVTYDMDYVEIPVLLRLAWMKRERAELFGTAGTVLAIKVRDRYKLEGLVTDGAESVPLYADADMPEVDMFDFSMTYGFGLEFPLLGRSALLEYRFTMGMNTLYMPTYAYVPFEGDDNLVDNEPVPLKNQCHFLMLGFSF
ncbi:MAG: porin family protein [bacterium]